MLLLLPDLPKRPVWLAALAASCLILIVPVWLAHRLSLAMVFCAAAAALLVHLKSSSQPAPPAKQNVSGPFHAALLITFLALLPALRGGLAAAGEHAALSLADLLASRTKAAPRQPQSSGAGFHGIILWPFPDRSKVPPPAPQRASAAPSPRRPLVIPFRGPYLYFKPWMGSPGPLAHVARGSPLHVSVRTSGGDLLRMDAQQDLAAPLLLSCCRAIEVSLDDQEPGQAGVTVGLLLTDTTAPGNPAQDLGLQRVEAGAPQSSKVLRFLLPRPARITKFTRLTVLLFPSEQHESQGRRIAVEQFALIPR